MVTRRSFLKSTAVLTAQALAGQTVVTSALIDRAEAITGYPIGLLKQNLGGNGSMVLMPADPNYATYNISFNKRTLRLPQVRVLPIDTAAVSRAILWAQSNRVPFAIRGGGHSYEGLSQSEGMVIDTRLLNELAYDPTSETVRVGAGVKLGKLYSLLATRGRVIPAGSCPTVGVSGHVLGGGYGLLARKFGLACDNLISCEMVDAQGRVHNVSEFENPELFWALRGGGNGNFGVVTRFVFKTHALSEVSTFGASWILPPDQAIDVIEAWQRWAPHAPEDITSIFRLARAPGGLIKLRTAGLTAGTAQALQEELQPLLTLRPVQNFKIKTMGFIQSVAHFSGSDSYPAVFMKAKSDYLFNPMTQVGMQTLMDSLLKADYGITAIFDAYGGAISHKMNHETAFPHRENAKFGIQYYSEWSDPTLTNAKLKTMRDVYNSMRPHVSGAAYVNYCDLDLLNWQSAYYGQNLGRLIQVKAAVDPGNFFKHAQSIPLIYL